MVVYFILSLAVIAIALSAIALAAIKFVNKPVQIMINVNHQTPEASAVVPQPVQISDDLQKKLEARAQEQQAFDTVIRSLQEFMTGEVVQQDGQK